MSSIQILSEKKNILTKKLLEKKITKKTFFKKIHKFIIKL